MFPGDAANLGNAMHGDAHATCSPVALTGYTYHGSACRSPGGTTRKILQSLIKWGGNDKRRVLGEGGNDKRRQQDPF